MDLIKHVSFLLEAARGVDKITNPLELVDRLKQQPLEALGLCALIRPSQTYYLQILAVRPRNVSPRKMALVTARHTQC